MWRCLLAATFAACAGPTTPPTPPTPPIGDPDPVGIPCSGRLGFPALPSTPAPNAYFGELADLDGDGHVDLSYAAFGDMHVAHGRADGTFDPPVTDKLTLVNGNVRLGDLDGDGRPEGMYVDPNGGLFLMRTDGGHFSSPQGVANIPFNVTGLELADVDGDGRLDVVTRGAQQVVVVRNTAAGFAAPELFGVAGDEFSPLVVADVDGDGVADVVTGAQTTIEVVRGIGKASFAHDTYTVPVFTGLAVADATGDGQADVLLGTSLMFRAEVTIFANDGSGRFGAMTTAVVQEMTTTAPGTLAAVDVDGDGRVDLLANVGSDMMLMRATADGFAPPVAVAKAGQLLFRDLDGDSRIDLVVLDGSAIVSYVNTGGQLPYLRDEPHHGDALLAARPFDVDGDGRLDLVWFQPAAAVELATGPGTYAPAIAVPGFTVNASASAAADLDDDGRADLVFAGGPRTGRGRAQALLARDGTLVAAEAVDIDLAGVPVLADVDGDGVRDLLVGHGSTIEVHVGLGDGRFGDATDLWTGDRFGGVAFGDFDGDGVVDRVVVSGSGTVEVFGASGVQAFTGPDLPSSGAFVRDLNGDGVPDLLGFNRADAVVMLGNGDGTFATPLRTPVGPDVPGIPVAFADLDGDGHLDVIATGGSYVTILRGHGDGTFDAPLHFDAGSRVTSIAVSDVDGDGRLDLTVGHDVDGANLLRGRCL